MALRLQKLKKIPCNNTWSFICLRIFLSYNQGNSYPFDSLYRRGNKHASVFTDDTWLSFYGLYKYLILPVERQLASTPSCLNIKEVFLKQEGVYYMNNTEKKQDKIPKLKIQYKIILLLLQSRHRTDVSLWSEKKIVLFCCRHNPPFPLEIMSCYDWLW